MVADDEEENEEVAAVVVVVVAAAIDDDEGRKWCLAMHNDCLWVMLLTSWPSLEYTQMEPSVMHHMYAPLVMRALILRLDCLVSMEKVWMTERVAGRALGICDTEVLLLAAL